MKVIVALIIGISISFAVGCGPTAKYILGPNDSECKLWWIYDKGISDGPTPFFMCINEKKYRTYSITRFGTLTMPMTGDVDYSLTEQGKWEIKNASLFLQENYFSSIKSISDTVFLRPDVFLLDKTDKFHIMNCDCDSLIAQFKGGTIDSIKTLLHYNDLKR